MELVGYLHESTIRHNIYSDGKVYWYWDNKKNKTTLSLPSIFTNKLDKETHYVIVTLDPVNIELVPKYK